MKKRILGLCLAMAIAGGAFAQEKYDGSVKNWISGSLNLFGGGIQYERVLTPKISVGAEGYYSTLILLGSYGFEAFGRYYIWQGLNAELGLGFGGVLGAHDYEWDIGGTTYKNDNVWSLTTGFLINPGIAWKIDIGQNGKFFLEPKVTVPIVLGVTRPVTAFGYDDWDEFGAAVSFKASIAFGYSF
jgi:hypothetical protein